MPLPWQSHKTLEEAEEERERLDIELDIEQKKALKRKLKAEGVSIKSFGSLRAAWNWFRSH